jgi:hypothetical protein
MRIPMMIAAAIGMAAPAAAQLPAPVDYAKPASWICLPGRADRPV